jgi:hypothetical protein
VISPGTTGELRARADKWQAYFSQVVPALGLHAPDWHPPERYWRRTLEQQMEFQSAFDDFGAVILWQHIDESSRTIYPQPATAEFQLWQQWMPEGAGPAARDPYWWIWQPDYDREVTGRTMLAAMTVSAFRRLRGRLT